MTPPTGLTRLTAVRAGVHTTVQDLGRAGLARSGVPLAGALDPAALVSANRAVGNPDDAAGLECVLRGPTLLADREVWVCVVGAGWTLGPVRLTAGVPYAVGPLPAGLRCWVALSGGVAIAPVLGSRSTDTLSRLGGQVLRDGDELPLGAAGEAALATPRAAPALSPGEVTLRVVDGPHADRLVQPLGEAVFSVGPRSDRTGLRLQGDPLRSTGGDIATIGVLPGAVQLLPDGRPIVLLGNCQTTGGYPVVGVVCSADLRVAAQLRPGRVVRLASVGVALARELAAQAAL
ncbi:MAG: hypothetical protein QOJ11_3887 [Frankiales bacterium]|jgi:biotin-dependent carboxylase-like uncharacterized protein|nr:hypothetical protein [Frankiales bacterium]